jgi:hypothetical protein
MTCFTIWCWFLIINGTTTIEFWMKDVMQPRTAIENLKVVFGDISMWLILLPSVRSLGGGGAIWSRIEDRDEEDQ